VPFGVLQLPRLSRRRRRGSVEVRLGYTDGDWLTSGGATSRRRRSPGPVRLAIRPVVRVGRGFASARRPAVPRVRTRLSCELGRGQRDPRGKALLGNFTLTHWALSLDSFWLVDAPVYSVAVLVGGVHPQLLHLVPAVIAVASSESERGSPNAVEAGGADLLRQGPWSCCSVCQRMPSHSSFSSDHSML